MLLPLTLICKKGKARRDGTSAIKIQYCYTSDKRTELDTGIALPPRYWNRKSRKVADDLPEAYGKAKDLNARLQTMFRIAEDIITFALDHKLQPLDFVKEKFSPDFDTATLKQDEATLITQATVNTDIYYQFEDFINFKARKVSKPTIKTFRDVCYSLKAFEAFRGKPITFQSFDMDFGEAYIDFLTFDYSLRKYKDKPDEEKGLMLNTIRLYVNYLRCFLNNRMRKGLTGPMDLTTLKAPGEESDAVYLSWDEISLIYQTDLTGEPLLETVRDMFVLGCLTGMRYSDYSSIDQVNIKDGFLKKKQKKTDHWVFVPLRPEAQEILDRYNGKIPRMQNDRFNQRIREVGKRAGLFELVQFSYRKGNQTVIEVKPKYEWLSSHTARRSFCTNEFMAGTPVELIMKLSGHKVLAHFYKYIRISPEEAGRKVQAIWAERAQTLRKPAPEHMLSA